ncbi:MAG TPA: DUF1080 domain-containing protein [Roseimicrobium sp.]|nr:DUF1080 domain-containing protein [Roseimicrobium sp.]
MNSSHPNRARTLSLSLFTLGTALALLTGCSTTSKSKPGAWQPLTDGKTFAGWRTYKPDGKIGTGWVYEDGMLKKQAAIEGGDIITEKTYDNFELSWDWRIAKAGNNGIKYFILDERKSAVGHEYQMLDDDGHPDGKIGPHRQTGAFYDVLPPMKNRPIKPVGEWNSSRVIVQGNHVEHWLNSVKVLQYECGSPEVMEAVAKSKFKKVEGFGTKVKGHILLTDHKDECWFRNLRIRELPAN